MSNDPEIYECNRYNLISVCTNVALKNYYDNVVRVIHYKNNNINTYGITSAFEIYSLCYKSATTPEPSNYTNIYFYQVITD